MALRRLSAAEIARLSEKPARAKKANPYTAELKSIKVGDGAMAVVSKEGLSRQGLKLKLTRAAKEAGVKIKYLRSGPDEVKFTVTERQG